MNHPLVSVCCIVYNHEKYLHDCLDGILMQNTSFDYDIIIHDDASTDSSAVIIREYCAKYPNLIKPILQPENQYSQGKRILPILFKQVDGVYIALCEGDDYWTDPYKLQKEVDVLEKDKTLIGVFTNSMTVDKQGNVLEERCEKIYPGNKQGRYTLHDFFQSAPSYPTATVVFRYIHGPEICAKMNHTYSKYLGDWTLWAILHSYGDFYYLDEVTSAYRINPTSLTHTVDRVGRAKASFSICKSLSEVLPAEYRKYLKKDGWMFFSVFMAYRKERKYINMVFYFIWCLVRYPKFTIRKLYSIVESRMH